MQIKNILNSIKNLTKRTSQENLTSEITDYNSAITNKTVEFKKQGSLYFLSAVISREGNWTANDTLFKIPAKYIPANGVACEVLGAGNSKNIAVSIYTDSRVAAVGDTSNSNWLRINATWIK